MLRSSKKIFFLFFISLLLLVTVSVGTTFAKYSKVIDDAQPEINFNPFEVDNKRKSGDPTDPDNRPGIEEQTPTTVYQVQPGETLTSIAEKFGITVEALAAYNGLDPDAPINPGTILHIPPTD